MKDWRKRSKFIPVLEQLEDRCVPSSVSAPAPAPALAVINGEVLCGGQGVPGVTITLTGIPAAGGTVNTTTQTDGSGDFTFYQVQPGSYTLTRGSSGLLVGGTASAGNLGGTVDGTKISYIDVQVGQVATNYNFTFSSLASSAINLYEFLSSAPSNLFESAGQTAGSGAGAADGSVQPNTAATYSSSATATLSGTVTQSGTALAGALVGLTGTDDTGADVFLTATTNSSGSYSFLPSYGGTYTLQILNVPTGYKIGTATAGSGSAGGLSLNNDQIFNIVIASGDSDTFSGYDFEEVSGTSATLGTQSLTVPTLTVDTSAADFTTTYGPVVDTTGGQIITNSNSETSATVDLTGTTTASTDSDTITVDLFSGTTTTTPLSTATTDSSGNFSFSSISLSAGENDFTVVAFDSKGNYNALSTFVVFSQAPTATSASDATSTVASGTTSTVVNLADGFSDSNSGGTIVELDVTAGSYSGPIYVALSDDATPQTVENFLEYVTSNEYNNVIFQRSVSDFVIQGGEYQLADTATGTAVLSDGTVTSVTITDGGSGYTSTAPTVTFSAPPSGGTTATGTATISGGHVTGVTITDAGSGYTSAPTVNFSASTDTLNTITANSSINSEATISSNTNDHNVAGTIAMALVGSNANSATDQFFFNLTNNESTLDSGNSSGNPAFTVFGSVLSGSDMRVVNTLASMSTVDESATDSDLANLPLVNYTGTDFPSDTTASNYVLITSAKVVSQPDQLTYTISNISDPDSVLEGATPTVNNNGTVTLNFTSNATGVVTFTATAKNLAGQSVTQTFTVYVGTVTTTTASSASATYSGSDQTVQLTANVTNTSTTAVSTGTVAFSVYNSSNVQIGTTATSGTVSNGVATASYTLPGGTNAGTYTIKAVYSGTSSLTPSNSVATLVVSAATPTVKASNETVTYNGTAQSYPQTSSDVTITGVSTGSDQTPTGSFSYSYQSTSSSYGPTATAPTVAGTYTVTATFTSNDPNYTNATGTATFTIKPATPVVNASDESATYNGTALSYPQVSSDVSVTGVSSGSDQTPAGNFSYSYYSSALGYGPTDTAPTDEGTYTVTVTFTTTDPNYSSPVNGTAVLTITPPV